jgi:hypothetical protein
LVCSEATSGQVLTSGKLCRRGKWLALALGLLVRHLLLKQFKKASLGYTLANAFGMSVIALLLLLAVGIGAAIITGNVDLLDAHAGTRNARE